MQFSELEQMYNAEANHWWFAGKRALFKRLLTDRLADPNLKIFDVGSGTGAVPAEFGSFGWICASDRSIDAIRFARSRGVRAVCCCDADALPIAGSSIDLILAFDILEHIEDDEAALAEFLRVLKPGGAAAIHVPAWPSLWSPHDEALEHKRRYTRKQFVKLLTGSRLKVEYLGWASTSILIPAFAVRTLRRILPRRRVADVAVSDIFMLPRPLNSILRRVYDVESTAAATVGLPFGVSLAAIVAKR